MSDEKFIMNGPIQLDMKVWIINDETGQSGQMTYSLPNFQHLDCAAMEIAIGKAMATLDDKGIDGFRVATKREAWNFVCEEKTGETFAMPGGESWDD